MLTQHDVLDQLAALAIFDNLPTPILDNVRQACDVRSSTEDQLRAIDAILDIIPRDCTTPGYKELRVALVSARSVYIYPDAPKMRHELCDVACLYITAAASVLVHVRVSVIAV